MKHAVTERWSGQENRLLMRLIDLHGSSWATIRKSFPSRSVSSVRNRFQRIVNGSKTVGKNRCKQCGAIKRGHVCKEGVSDDDLHIRSAAIENPSSDALEVRLDGVDCEEVEDTPRLFSWHAIRIANDMGFEDVTHPPPIVRAFPFVTSLP